MMKNKISKVTEIQLRGKTRVEVKAILGNQYIEDSEGNMIYFVRIFLFITKKIFIEFDENDVADTVIGL